MHTIEPHYRWRDYYIASEDERSPFYGRTYSEFEYSQKIYNYYIHPQWDEIEADTLYVKVLYADYEDAVAIIELIGEWNDAIGNDIMFLRQDLLDRMAEEGIHKYILIGENVLNFHASDDCYYEEWFENVSENDGWIVFINFLDHVLDEMKQTGIQHYVNLGGDFNDFSWRKHKPQHVVELVEDLLGQ